ncbi:MAG: Fic family protein [Steroidobacteraceae bacterium]
MALFDSLGFSWNRGSVPRELPRASVERAAFRFARMLPEYVWDAGVLEGNPFTFPEVKTLLDGVTVGGRKLSDQEQILNLAESSKYLLDLVRRQEFRLDKGTFCALHAHVARNEALEWGRFRGEGAETHYTPDVALGEHGRYTPPPTEPGAERLNAIFSKGLAALQESVPNPFERATAFFLFGSLQQFFFDGNKRTSRFMMNGALMTEGIDAISIPAMRAAEFNSKMVEFYTTRDATRMMGFVLECHPEFSRIRELNPELSLVRDAPAIREYRFDDPLPHADHPAAPARRDPDIPAAPQDGRRETAKTRLSAEEMRRRAVQDWRKLYGPEAAAADPANDRDEQGAPRHGRDADLDPSG